MVLQHLRRHRQAAKLSQAALASIVHVPQQAISSYERGLAVPRLSLAVALADALGVRVEQLLPRRQGRGR